MSDPKKYSLGFVNIIRHNFSATLWVFVPELNETLVVYYFTLYKVANVAVSNLEGGEKVDFGSHLKKRARGDLRHIS